MAKETKTEYALEVALRKLGNSIGILLPASWLKQRKLKPGDKFRLMDYPGGNFLLEPVKKR